MTRLSRALETIADQAPPLGDVADRALAHAHDRRRFRRRTVLPIGAAVACAVATVLLVSLLPGDTGQTTTVTGTPDWRGASIRFPGRVTEPLPESAAGTALLAYQPPCRQAGPGGQACTGWRLMTTDGRHWTLPDAARFETEAGGLPVRRSLVTVAPSGRRIAYVRPDGTFVLRDLESGETAELFRWEQDDSFNFASAVWSADGRRLLVSPGTEPFGESEPLPSAVLVDTGTGATSELPGPGGLFGVTDGDRPFPFGSTDADGNLPLFDTDGQVVDSIDGDLLPGQEVDGLLGAISPRGDTFAAITFPGQAYVAPRVLVVDLTGERKVQKYQIRRPWETWDSPEFVGWLGARQVAIRVDHLEDAGGDTMRLASMNVDAFDTRTGELERILRFPRPPGQVSIAHLLLR